MKQLAALQYSRAVWLAVATALTFGCGSPLIRGVNENGLLGYIKSGRGELDSESLAMQRWRADMLILPYVEFRGEEIVLRNVRNCVYRTESDYDVRHYDMRFRLDAVRTVDFLVVPFKESDLLAHTMLSFGLDDGRHFIISVEARIGQDQDYSAVAGTTRQFPLMYIVGDERDLILLRARVRQVDVHLYRGRAEPQQVQDLLVDMLARVNKLQRQPEYYDTLTNNCTTNLVQHVNKLRPGRIPYDWRVLLPGHSDRLAYELGLLEIQGPFEVARVSSRINELALAYANDPEFSKRIRRE